MQQARASRYLLYLLYWYKSTKTDACSKLELPGADFTCFTGTKVQTLTQKTLAVRPSGHILVAAAASARNAGRIVAAASAGKREQEALSSALAQQVLTLLALLVLEYKF